MEDTSNSLESLLERAADYGATSFELVKLKALDKTTDSASSFLSHTLVVSILGSIILFINLGAALWIGELLGKIYFGFLIVAAFYVVVAFIAHVILQKWIKRMFYNYIIKGYKLEAPTNDSDENNI